MPDLANVALGQKDWKKENHLLFMLISERHSQNRKLGGWPGGQAKTSVIFQWRMVIKLKIVNGASPIDGWWQS